MSPHSSSNRRPPGRIRWAQIGTGVAALILGTLVYFVARPPERIYFLQKLGQDLSLYGKAPNLFGAWAFSLPTFVHVFGFSLITAGLIRRGWTTDVFVCAGWAGINIIFELGQKYKDQATAWVPAWFEHIPFLENTVPYFRNGAFDPGDVTAAVAGAVVGFIVILLFRMTIYRVDRSN